MNIVKFNMKINTIEINIANNSIDQRSRSYDNSEVSQDYLKWRLAPTMWNLVSETLELVRKESARHVSGVGISYGAFNPLLE